MILKNDRIKDFSKSIGLFIQGQEKIIEVEAVEQEPIVAEQEVEIVPVLRNPELLIVNPDPKPAIDVLNAESWKHVDKFVEEHSYALKEKSVRMYFLVMYNLSGIQKGIQAGHAALEYANRYGDLPVYKAFVNLHKTFILLDGGGSIEMEQNLKEIESLNIPFAEFREPDLNGAISAIAFLVGESDFKYIRNRPQDGGVYYVYPEPSALEKFITPFRLASN